MLEEQLHVEVPLGKRVRMWYLHSGAPPHFARLVTGWLNNHLPNRPVAWPPRSPDFNPCDRCLWGWMKQLVYGNKQCPETIKELQHQLEVAAGTVRGTPGGFLRNRRW